MRRVICGLVAAVLSCLGVLTMAPGAQALPLAPSAPDAVPGIPSPCYSTNEWPQGASLASIKSQLEKRFGLSLSGSGWTDPQYRAVVKQIWTTLDAVDCVPYLDEIRTKIKASKIKIVAGPTRSWAWADWGLTNPNQLTFDFAKWATALPSDPGRLSRIVIHELGHAYNVDRDGAPGYWSAFTQLYAQHGKFSNYGDNNMETFSEVIGYYVARCALDNPYDDPAKAKTAAAYYEFAKTYIFHGVEFGPGPGAKPSC